MSLLTKEQVWTVIVDSLRTLLLDQDQELGEVTAATSFNHDLDIASIDIIHLMVGLEDKFNTPLNFDELVTLPDGNYRNDLTLGELLDFVAGVVLSPAGSETLAQQN